MSHSPKIRLVVFDWAGTTVDHGCFAPIAPFIESFAQRGVRITIAQARQPMGLHKRDHIRELLTLPDVAADWRKQQGRDWTEDDVEDLFANGFVPLQMEAVHRHAGLVPGLLDCVAALRDRGIKIGTSTGYFRDAAEAVYAEAREQGYSPDFNVCAEDVPMARPAPWMIYRNMEATGVYPARCVLKVGDTEPDIGEGISAGVWTAGVTTTGSFVGSTVEEFGELPAEQRLLKVHAASEMLREAGANDIIDSVADVPALIDDLNERLAAGRRP